MKSQWFSEISPERAELVFRLKNKNYGAYQLRKSYPIIMTKILFSMVAVLLLSGLMLRSFLSSPPKAMFENEQVYITEWNIEPLTKEEFNPKPRPDKQRLKTNTQTFSGQKHKAIRTENTTPVVQDTTESQSSVNATTNTASNTNLNGQNEGSMTGTDSEYDSEDNTISIPDKIELVPDKPAMFVGGYTKNGGVHKKEFALSERGAVE